MTSRDIVRRAITYQTPPRLPTTMGRFGTSDVAGVGLKPLESFEPACPGADEWGCVWSKTDVKNMGQVKGHPLENLSKLDSHPVPDYTDDSRYVDVAEGLARVEAEGKYICCGIFMVLFERMHSLHGFENVLVNLYQDRPAMEALAARIADVHITLVNEMSRRFPDRIDGWRMTDDWGTQQAAFVSSEMWMDFFFPHYKRIFDAMHEAGCDVWVHSCGKVNEIIEGYIQAGVDVVNLQQPRALGIEDVGHRYRGRIAFESLADIQSTLPTGDRGRVDEDVRLLMNHWASDKGGFVFCDYGDDEGIGVTDPTIKRYMYDAFSRRSEELYGQPLPEPTLESAAG